MKSHTPPRIAIAFYGITRSLTYTYESIERNLILPSHAHGHCNVFCHFFDQPLINNTRTKEFTEQKPDEWKLLKPSFAQISPLNEQSEKIYLDALKPYGNAWEDDWQSLRNILRQLFSLSFVTKMIEAQGGYDYVVFARPDMEYHNPIIWSSVVRKASPFSILIPDWQWSGGLNDRFAICGSKAFRYYGHRLHLALAYCKSRHRAMHSERLLFYTLMHSPTILDWLPIHATRVRSNGDRAMESFLKVKLAKLIEAYAACNVYSRFFARPDWPNDHLHTLSTT